MIYFSSLNLICLTPKQNHPLLRRIKKIVQLIQITHHIIGLASFVRIWITFFGNTGQCFAGDGVIVWAGCVHFNCCRFAILIRCFYCMTNIEFRNNINLMGFVVMAVFSLFFRKRDEIIIDHFQCYLHSFSIRSVGSTLSAFLPLTLSKLLLVKQLHFAWNAEIMILSRLLIQKNFNDFNTTLWY